MLAFLRALIGRPAAARPKQTQLSLEQLEDRTVPTVVSPDLILLNPAAAPAAGPGLPAGFSPAQIRQAYGFNQIAFSNGAVQGDGSGQTIAIVDAYDQPNIASDLAVFDATFGLPNPPNFTKVNQGGGAALPPADTTWGLEISLDVEWAHAVAPGANILLVETNSSNGSDLMAGVNFARSQPGVSVVSMSWAAGEFSGEASYDGYFTTPAGHNGVTFVASSGDNGSSGPPSWPSVSANVLAVGGTQLSTDVAGNYLGETGWSGSGGGVSTQLAKPSYQYGVVSQGGSMRTAPDVAYDASPSTPFALYDTLSYGGWLQVGGTSAGAPQWAGLIAIADQGLALAGQGTLDGGTQTLPMLYQLPAGYFHDVTAGSNGAYAAGPGYDLVTGRGSPLANLVVAGLVGAAGGGSAPSNGPPPSNPPFITRLYSDLLHRNPSPNETAYWQGQLNAGVAQSQVVHAFMTSPEYLSDVVNAEYVQYLGRAADAGGVAAWVAHLQAGMSQEQVAAALMQSPEYFQAHGGSFAGWLNGLYQNVLNRPVDGGGLASWSAVQAGGASLQQIALSVLNSAEADSIYINSVYLSFLQRPADAGGLANWVSAMQHGATWEDIVGSLASSAEFMQG